MSRLFAKRWLPLTILVVSAGLAYLLLNLKPEPTPLPKAEPPIPSLAVVRVQPQEQRAAVESQGTVQPKWQIELVAETGGRVVRVADQFVNGGFFRKGDELLKIEPVDYEVAVAQAESRLASARQVLAQERGQARLAAREWQELGNTEANELFLRKPQIAAAEAALKTARIELEKAKQDLERTSIRAPFDGRLLRADVQVGDQVANGQSVGQAFATTIMEVPLPLTSRQVGLVDLPLYADAEIGVPVRFTIDVGGSRYHWQGIIVRTEASFDAQSRVVYAIAEVTGAYERRDDGSVPFAPGLFARAQITGKAFADAVALPRSALYERDNLLVLDSDNRLRITPVDVLQADGEQALVRGVSAGTAVLLERPSFLIKGMQIHPVEQATAQR